MWIEDANIPGVPSPGTETMPLLFLGHGSPMNAIEENEFTKGFRDIAKSIPKPKAILCISAHWETNGTFVTAMDKPRTIHDFYGFPKELFDVQYPAPGSPELAQEVKDAFTKTKVALDYEWGLDHGCWSVVKFLYPDADIPVIQFSLDYTKDSEKHYELAKELLKFREKGILIVGSGNIVHNLGILDWQKKNSGFEWAEKANNKFVELILANNHYALINYANLGNEFMLAIPTPEHYLPLLYILALIKDNEKISVFNNKLVYGSLSMASLKIG